MSDKRDEIPSELDKLLASPGYAFSQLSKALGTAEGHEDQSIRGRAQTKANKWLQVISRMLDGTLLVGSRAPLLGIPVWVTSEVMSGGFATGNLLAGGPLKLHERYLRQKLPQGTFVTFGEDRTVFNTYFLSDEGIQDLQQKLQSGLYEVEVPEEGAIPVVAWLLKHGQLETVRAILNEIGPHFKALRFYPAPADAAVEVNQDFKVLLQDVGTTISYLQGIVPSEQILAQKEAIEIWAPLYDEMVSLLLETVEGEAPNYGPDGSVSGRQPNANVSKAWQQRAAVLLERYAILRKSHYRCKRPSKEKDSFFQIRHFLHLFATDPRKLGEKELSRVRVLLARYVKKRGAPDSSKCTYKRQLQQAQTAGLTYDKISHVLLERLSRFPKKGGLESLEKILEPLPNESTFSDDSPKPIPSYFTRKLNRSLSDTPESLIEQKIITSGDTLARVLPQITATIHATAFKDPELQKLYYSIYKAFRKRRSLLLLNLEHQVRLEELPWIAALNEFRTPNSNDRELAKRSFQKIAALTLSAFPYAIVPNKLLQEFRALARQAELSIPLVDELAADIFMGTFSEKFLEAAKISARMLRGTVYERYYHVDFETVLKIDDVEKSKYGVPTSFAFSKLCSDPVQKVDKTSPVVQNGMIIEQQQIYTTQNLAALFDALDLKNTLSAHLPQMAKKCFTHICSKQEMKITDHHTRLTVKKNCAYAWRQMIFYLSHLTQEEQMVFADWAKKHLGGRTKALQDGFGSVLAGLLILLHPALHTTTEVKSPFLGWGTL